MTSVPISFTNGTFGKVEVDTLNMVPGGGQASHSFLGKPHTIKNATKAPKLLPDNLDYSTRRQPLPCKGITHQVIRTAPPSYMAGIHPPMGIGRGQLPSMANGAVKAGKILPMSDPFASGFNSPLGQPGLKA